MATRGDLNLATSGDFYMATDRLIRLLDSAAPGVKSPATISCHERSGS